ncbi:MAG: tetratricopeptide repeat protein [Candidatus Tectimicrobiota bacterium]
MYTQLLQQASAHFRQGDLQHAEHLYRAVLQQQPRQAEALHGLGLLAMQRGQTGLAGALLRQAIAQRPAEASLYNSLGHLLMQQGQLTAAAEAYHTALHYRAAYPEAHYNLGLVWHTQGEYQAARQAYASAIQLQPDFAAAHNNLAVVLQHLGELDAARQAGEMAVRYQPDCAEAQNNLGVILLALGDSAAAVAACATAVRLQPDDAAAQYNLGSAYAAQEQHTAARHHYQQAVRLQPNHAAAHYNLGVVAQALHDLEGARQAYEAALRLQPEDVESHNNLATVYRDLGRFDAAQAHLAQALRLQPDCVKARWNRALVHLAQGNLAAGWADYEWRLAMPGSPGARFPQPRWDGTPVAEKTLLVHAEQGVGDEILFASCVPEVLPRCKHLVLECDARLASLFARSFPDATVYGADRHAPITWLDELPAIDLQVPCGSLPLYVRPSLGHFPRRCAYLHPDPARQAQYQQRLEALGSGLKVGLAWRSVANRRRELDYTTLLQWGPVLSLPGVHWVSLQYDDPAAELAEAQAHWGVPIHTWPDLDLFHDFEGIAALISCLDLVLAPEITVAALAGALGTRVWRLSVAGGSWTSLGTVGSPWFPQMRLLCQPSRGAWEPVLQQIGEELTALLLTETRQ